MSVSGDWESGIKKGTRAVFIFSMLTISYCLGAYHFINFKIRKIRNLKLPNTYSVNIFQVLCYP